jgi:hypothetical protein
MNPWENWVRLQKVNPAARNREWETEALHLLSKLNYQLIYKEAKEGPDGWPYLWVTPVESEQGSESFRHITNWLQSRGIGLAILPAAGEQPDFVFSYGMIWNYIETGKFVVEGGTQGGDFTLKDGQTAWVGSPSEEYFPSYARGILKRFLMDQGVLNPKILMVSQDQKHYDLAFSVESLGNPDKSEWEGVLQAFSWFLPTHYSLAMLSESVFREFVDL